MNIQTTAQIGAISILALGLLMVIYFAKLALKRLRRDVPRPSLSCHQFEEGVDRDGI